MKIGIFDSGSGGISTLCTIRHLCPEHQYYYIGDYENCPYGDKTSSELLWLTTAIVDRLQDWGAEIIVIACNTATTHCIEALRARFPKITFVGTEPAIKLAYDHDCQKILLMATPATTQAYRMQQLLNQNSRSANTEVTILPCHGLADTIEHGLNKNWQREGFKLTADAPFSLPNLSENGRTQVRKKLSSLLQEYQAGLSYDAVILGCTHYTFVRDELTAFFPNAQLFDGNLGVAGHVQKICNFKKQKN